MNCFAVYHNFEFEFFFSFFICIDSSDWKTSSNKWNWFHRIRNENHIFGNVNYSVCVFVLCGVFKWNAQKMMRIYFATRRAPQFNNKTTKRSAVVAARVYFKFRSVTPMMTSEDDPVSADFHFVGSKMMLCLRVGVVGRRNRLCFPHDTIPVHELIVGPHAPYLPYWLPLIQQQFGVSICSVCLQNHFITQQIRIQRLYLRRFICTDQTKAAITTARATMEYKSIYLPVLKPYLHLCFC